MIRTTAVLLILSSLFCSAPAAATVFCLAPGTASQLNAQLNAINQLNELGRELDLRFQSGFFDLSGVGTDSEALPILRNSEAAPTRMHRISGGWNAGCTQQAELNTSQTRSVLDTGGAKRLLHFRHGRSPGASSASVSLRIDQLTLRGSPSCLRVSPDLGGNPSHPIRPLDVTVERVRIESCGSLVDSSPNGAAMHLNAFDGNLTIRNSVFTTNRGNAAAFRAIAGNILAVYHNTLRFNESNSSSDSSMVALSASTIYFQNNLIGESAYGGPARDIHITQGAAFVRNNRYSGSVFQATQDLLITSGNTAVAPGFAAVGFNPDLAPTSPMRDQGLLSVPAPGYGTRDFYGNPRVQGAAPDIGAFELPPLGGDELFRNSFEAN